MATIKELEANREKLRMYDELKEWKENFVNMQTDFLWFPAGKYGVTPVPHELPDNIKAIIVNALQSKIEKLDEE